jgi:YesN/AraC family two-component response regulator
MWHTFARSAEKRGEREVVEKNKKLLVVDDEEIIRKYTRMHFERRGYQVLIAASAEEALPIIREENPDIMLLDIDLPQMSGIDLLELTREFNTNIKVIMVSGYGADFKRDPRLQCLGVLEFLSKPVGFAELEITIKRTEGLLNKAEV